MPNDTWCVGGLCDDVTAEKRAACVESVTRHSLFRQIMASSAGSIVSTLSLNPINVVKVRLQNSTTTSSVGGTGFGSQSLLGVIRTIFRTQGWSGFWSGTQMGIIMSVPNTVLYMSAYEELKYSLQYLGPSVGAEAIRTSRVPTLGEETIESTRVAALWSAYNAVIPAVAGALARMVAVTVISPLELIRTIQTAGGGGGGGGSVSDIARGIVRQHGVRGLYRGWAPSVLRDCPFSAIYWLGFESLRPRFATIVDYSSNAYNQSSIVSVFSSAGPSSSSSSYSSSNTTTEADGAASTAPATHATVAATAAVKYTPFVTFLSGATSGMVAAVCTHPFDVLKTQQQVATWNPITPTTPAASTPTRTSSPSSMSGASSSLDACQSIRALYRQGGRQALFRGLTMRLATVIPASAIMITIYETIKTLDV